MMTQTKETFNQMLAQLDLSYLARPDVQIITEPTGDYEKPIRLTVIRESAVLFYSKVAFKTALSTIKKYT